MRKIDPFKLKVERVTRRIKQADLARRLNLHPSTLCRIENGSLLAKPELLERIKRELDAA